MRRNIQEDFILSYINQAASVSVATGAPLGAGDRQRANSETVLQSVLSSLADTKAEDLVQIDLRGRSEMADYMIVASGRSTRQVAAMSDNLTDELKQKLGVLCKVEGKDQGDWVLIDAGDVIVHIFRPEVREFYQIEKMWAQPGAARN